jgi:hypothetical protein
MIDKKFGLGVKLRDKVTGFTGIATAYIEYINGCKQYALAPPVDKDGKIQDSIYFDEQRLDFVDHGVCIEAKETGGASGRGETPPRSY